MKNRMMIYTRTQIDFEGHRTFTYQQFKSVEELIDYKRDCERNADGAYITIHGCKAAEYFDWADEDHTVGAWV